jgi:hypothetical protein
MISWSDTPFMFVGPLVFVRAVSLSLGLSPFQRAGVSALKVEDAQPAEMSA